LQHFVRALYVQRRKGVLPKLRPARMSRNVAIHI
jgi:hypothetical protein